MEQTPNILLFTVIFFLLIILASAVKSFEYDKKSFCDWEGFGG